MNLRKLYNKTKGKQGGQFLAFICSLGLSFGILYGINLLWNYLAPVWSLPKLTFLQFLGTLFITLFLKHLLGLIATGRSVYPNIEIMKIGKPPYDGNQ